MHHREARATFLVAKTLFENFIGGEKTFAAMIAMHLDNSLANRNAIDITSILDNVGHGIGTPQVCNRCFHQSAKTLPCGMLESIDRAFCSQSVGCANDAVQNVRLREDADTLRGVAKIERRQAPAPERVSLNWSGCDNKPIVLADGTVISMLDLCRTSFPATAP